MILNPFVQLIHLKLKWFFIVKSRWKKMAMMIFHIWRRWILKRFFTFTSHEHFNILSNWHSEHFAHLMEKETVSFAWKKTSLHWYDASLNLSANHSHYIFLLFFGCGNWQLLLNIKLTALTSCSLRLLFPKHTAYGGSSKFHSEEVKKHSPCVHIIMCITC